MFPLCRPASCALASAAACALVSFSACVQTDLCGSKVELPFDESGVVFSTAEFDEFAADNVEDAEENGATAGPYTVPWDQVPTGDRCEHACALINDVSGNSGLGENDKLKLKSCELVEGDASAGGGGTVSCSGEVVSKPFCN